MRVEDLYNSNDNYSVNTTLINIRTVSSETVITLERSYTIIIILILKLEASIFKIHSIAVKSSKEIICVRPRWFWSPRLLNVNDNV